MNDVQALLTQAADAAGEFPAPTADSLRRRARRQIRMRTVVAVTSVVVLVAALAVALSLRTQHRTPTAQRSQPSVQPGPSAPAVTAAQLKHYRWRSLPEAPISPRDGAAVVWSGTKLLVWGGDSGHTYFADGAAYEPRTRTWTKLPAAPLSGRTDAAAAWVDGVLVVWGGQDAHGGLADGAAFDPRSGRWSALPASPLPAHGAQGFAVGPDFVVVSSDAQHDSRTVHAAEYDVRSGAWRALPDIVLATGHTLDFTAGLAAGSTLFVWAYWYHSSRFSMRGGADAYALRNGSWIEAPVAPRSGSSSAYPLWTGTRVILAGEQSYCGPCPAPAQLALRGEQIDPVNGTRTPISVAPQGAFGAFLWTGAAMVAIGAAGTITDSRGKDVSHSGVWDPATNAWTTLPPAPGDGLDTTAAVWAGDRVLVWGGDGTAGGVEFAP